MKKPATILSIIPAAISLTSANSILPHKLGVSLRPISTTPPQADMPLEDIHAITQPPGKPDRPKWFQPLIN